MILAEPILTERLALRTLTEADASEAYVGWMSDAEVTRYLESRFRAHSRSDIADFILACNAGDDSLLLGLTLRESGAHIGNIKLGPIDPHHARGEIGLMIGERAAWGRGYAREAIAALSRHALDALGLNKVTAGCYGSNIGSLKAFLAAGFVEEGRRPRQFRCGEGWEDGVLLGRWRGMDGARGAAA